mgnify:CR=1 FL=1
MKQLKLFIYSYAEMFLNFFPDFYVGNRMRRLFYSFYFKNCGKNLIVNYNCHFEVPENITLGNNCSFNRNCWVSGGGGLIIGNNVIFGPNIIIHSANHNYENPLLLIKEQGHTFKKVTLGDNIWIGAGAIILPGVNIGSNSIIAAGAVVTKDIEKNSIFGGVPAKFIKNVIDE